MRAKPFEAQATLLRFLLTQTDECLIWPHSLSSSGYGQIGADGTVRNVHVVACEQANGPRPKGMEAAHACGVRACCNARHMRWATPAENNADMDVHGTRARGSKISRLTEEQVHEIRGRVGQSQTSIALEFGVTQKTVSDIRSRRRWGWLPDEADSGLKAS